MIGCEYPRGSILVLINALGSRDPLWRGVGAPTTAHLTACQIGGSNSSTHYQSVCLAPKRRSGRLLP